MQITQRLNSLKTLVFMGFLLVTSTVLIPNLAFAERISNAFIDCDNPATTVDINRCAVKEKERDIQTMRQYLIASYTRYKDDPDSKEIIEAIKKSQQDWQTYTDSNCGAVYTVWQSGTFRGVMSIECQKRMVKQRTHELWLNYLTYMDSTPPILPEPILSDTQYN